MLLRHIVPCIALFGYALAPGGAIAGELCSVAAFEADPKQAVAICTSILQAEHLTTAERAEALKIRGRSLRRVGQLDDAIRDYEEALKLAPDDAELHVRRGWTAYDKRDSELVFAQASRALELKPDYAEAYELIGVNLDRNGSKNFEKAKAAVDEAVRLQPLEPGYLFDRMILLEHNGSLGEAIDQADALLRLPPELITKPGKTDLYLRPTTYRTATELKRAIWLQSVGRIREAAQAYDLAVEHAPDPLTYSIRAGFRFSQAAFVPPAPPPASADAQEDIDKALALDPDYWLALNLQAKHFRLRGEYEKAAEYYAKALKGYPINGTMRWNYAATLRQLGRTEDAVAEAYQALRLDPGFMGAKLGYLGERGYLASLKPDVDPRPIVMDAVRACMLDKDCQ